MAERGVRIIGTGSYLPERIMTNAELEKMVDTSDEWIQTRTGIQERHIAAEGQPTSALAAEAAKKALTAANLSPEGIDLIIVATMTGDMPFPNTGCFVQKQIGAWNAACFEMEAACAGFVYALDVGTAMVQSGRYKRALVCGAECMSAMLNWQDRSTCVLFGDGAGALILEACGSEDNNIIGSMLASDGHFTELLQTPGGGSAIPFSPEVLEKNLHCLHMKGSEIFRLAVNNMVKAAKRAMVDADITIDQIRWLVPHQANIRIIHAIARRLKISDDNCYINVQRTGNTSAATIPIAIDELVQKELLSKGDYILTVAFGGGLTFGSNLIQW